MKRKILYTIILVIILLYATSCSFSPKAKVSVNGQSADFNLEYQGGNR